MANEVPTKAQAKLLGALDVGMEELFRDGSDLFTLYPSQRGVSMQARACRFQGWITRPISTSTRWEITPAGREALARYREAHP